MNRNARIAKYILLYSLAAFLLAVGLDKALHLEKLTDWEALVGPVSSAVFPFAAETIVRIQGCIEVLIAALVVFSPWKRIALGLFLASLTFTVLDLSSLRYYLLIVRDLFIAAAAASLIVMLSPERR